jgi:hypothetical protein
MPNIVDISQDIFPDPALIDALRSEHSPAEALRLLARLRDRVKENRTGLKRQADRFDQAYEEAARGGLDAEGLVQLAEAVLQGEKGAAEQLYPWMEALKQTLAPRAELHAHEAQQYLQELHDIAVAWLTTYQSLRERLLKLASERGEASGGILRARPVEGDIDHETMTREIVARFPKILAALAK